MGVRWQVFPALALLSVLSGGAPGPLAAQALQDRSQGNPPGADRQVGATETASICAQSAALPVTRDQGRVAAARRAFCGTQQEAGQGKRDVIDVLNAAQELLDAQINLVSGRTDATISGYAIATGAGRGRSGDLRIGVKRHETHSIFSRGRSTSFGQGRWRR